MTVADLRHRRTASLADLLDAYGRDLKLVASLILHDDAEADDVVVETLLTAFEQGASIRDDRALRAWLLKVATNHALGRLRRARRLVRLDILPDRAAGGDFASESADRLALLAAIGTLPIRMRTALVLRYYADLGVDEVAAVLGRSPNTIKAQLQAALDHLRGQFPPEPLASIVPEVRHGG